MGGEAALSTTLRWAALASVISEDAVRLRDLTTGDNKCTSEWPRIELSTVYKIK